MEETAVLLETLFSGMLPSSPDLCTTLQFPPHKLLRNTLQPLAISFKSIRALQTSWPECTSHILCASSSQTTSGSFFHPFHFFYKTQKYVHDVCVCVCLISGRSATQLIKEMRVSQSLYFTSLALSHQKMTWVWQDESGKRDKRGYFNHN